MALMIPWVPTMTAPFVLAPPVAEGEAEPLLLLLLEPEGEAAPDVAEATEPLAVGARAAATRKE